MKDNMAAWDTIEFCDNFCNALPPPGWDKNTETFADPDGSPAHTWVRTAIVNGSEHRWLPPARESQKAQPRDAMGNLIVKEYPEELRLLLLAEEKADHASNWTKVHDREKWGTSGPEIIRDNPWGHPKIVGHSLSNEMKKKYIAVVGDDFSPEGSGNVENRMARTGGSLNDPACFTENYIKELWDRSDAEENAIGRAMHLAKLAELKRGSSKVATKVLTPMQLKVYYAMLTESSLTVVASELGKSVAQIHAMRGVIAQKIRKALGVKDPPVEAKYEGADGPMWNPLRLDTTGHENLGHGPHSTEDDYGE